MAESDEPWLELHGYWLSRHRDGRAPGRADLDPPLEISHLVDRLMLIEIAGENFRYRLIGSAITGGMNLDLTSTIVGASGWASAEFAAAWIQMLESVRDQAKPLLVITSLPGQKVAINHCIALPLLSATGHTEMIIVGIFYGGQTIPGARPEGLTVREVGPIL
jgi:hypothetical protein